MRRERVADDIYVFTSELYAQVTAGIVVTPQGAVLIDSMVFPEEARAIRRFVEDRLSSRVRYIINTHYHADHTYGNCFFEGAIVVGHTLCYDLLTTRGKESLDEAKQSASIFEEVSICPPHVVFETGHMELRVGNKTFELRHTPGHSPDSSIVLVREDRVLFAGDTVMPIPYFVDGSFDESYQSLTSLRNGGFENIVQGHGEIILRGEIEHKLEEDLRYLVQIREHVNTAMTKADPIKYLRNIDIETVGKSRILLNGGVEELHQMNLRVLYDRLKGKENIKR
jgi:cyclase